MSLLPSSPKRLLVVSIVLFYQTVHPLLGRGLRWQVERVEVDSSSSYLAGGLWWVLLKIKRIQHKALK